MRILITGSNGYIGRKLKEWLGQWPDMYEIETINLKESSWREKDFSVYDAIVHLAAVVHKKESAEMRLHYTKVNEDLTIEVASLAKKANVNHFIFMSSISVYGLEGSIKRDYKITEQTICKPKSFYGKSKLNAEYKLNELIDEKFCVSIIRAPMIYGPDCPGNFLKLKLITLKTPVFPLINNSRSMLYIDNLTECIKLILDYKTKGMFFPQNNKYVNTMNIVKIILKENHKTIKLSPFLGFLIKCFGRRIVILNKVFGDLEIDMNLSSYMGFAYNVVDFEESIILSIK